MNDQIRQILEGVKSGQIPVEEALLAIKKQPFTDIGYAKVDLHRKIRQGAAEVIYGAGKTPEQMVGILKTMAANGQKTVLITRLSADAAAQVAQQYPMDYREEAKVGIVGPIPLPDGMGKIVVATGGTSDIPVAEEAALTAEVHGNEVVRLYDVGVAGLHRLLAHLDDIMGATVIIAIAGMEGALASSSAGWPIARSSPCPPAWAMAQPLAALPLCCLCSIPVPAAFRWSTSTTALARATLLV